MPKACLRLRPANKAAPRMPFQSFGRLKTLNNETRQSHLNDEVARPAIRPTKDTGVLDYIVCGGIKMVS